MKRSCFWGRRLCHGVWFRASKDNRFLLVRNTRANFEKKMESSFLSIAYAFLEVALMGVSKRWKVEGVLLPLWLWRKVQARGETLSMRLWGSNYGTLEGTGRSGPLLALLFGVNWNSLLVAGALERTRNGVFTFTSSGVWQEGSLLANQQINRLVVDRLMVFEVGVFPLLWNAICGNELITLAVSEIKDIYWTEELVLGEISSLLLTALSTGYCLMSTAYCLLSSAYWLSTAYCLLKKHI